MPSISKPPPLPGFGLHLNYDPEGSDENNALFPSALNPDLDDRDAGIRCVVASSYAAILMDQTRYLTDYQCSPYERSR